MQLSSSRSLGFVRAPKKKRKTKRVKKLAAPRESALKRFNGIYRTRTRSLLYYIFMKY